jgi:hypothetical protein
MLASPVVAAATTPRGSPAASRAARATVMGAFVEGWRRVLHAPVLVAGMLLITIAVAAPMALLLQRELAAQLGHSTTADRVLYGWDEQWALEVSSASSGIGRTFTHEILGFGGTLALVSRFVDATAPNPFVAVAISAYVVLWTFLSGGLLDRLARGRPVRTAAFFGACGVHVWRFLRLAIVVAPCYWVLFHWIHPLLFETIYGQITRNSTAEHVVLIVRVALYAVFLTLLMIVSLVADMTKVRIVVEDRHSALAAVGAALRFIRRRAGRMTALYLLNIVAALVLARLWLQVAPEASMPSWRALLAGEVYVLARLWAKLAFMASEVAFFQGELAHRPYTAMPEPVWPDSPAVEAITRLAGGESRRGADAAR